MSSRSAFVALMLLVGTSSLAGCGGSDPEEPAASAPTAVASTSAAEPAPSEAEGDGDVAAAEPIGPGAYQFDYMGAVGNIEIPLSPDDPGVAELEAYRKLTGSDDVGYVRVIVDNMGGTEDINMYQVVAVTSAGEQVEFSGLAEAIATWRGRLAEDDVAGYNRGIDLTNEQQFFLLPGAKGTALLVNPEPVTEVARVFVYPAGAFDRIEAYKVR